MNKCSKWMHITEVMLASSTIDIQLARLLVHAFFYNGSVNRWVKMPLRDDLVQGKKQTNCGHNLMVPRV